MLASPAVGGQGHHPPENCRRHRIDKDVRTSRFSKPPLNKMPGRPRPTTARTIHSSPLAHLATWSSNEISGHKSHHRPESSEQDRQQQGNAAPNHWVLLARSPASPKCKADPQSHRTPPPRRTARSIFGAFVLPSCRIRSRSHARCEGNEERASEYCPTQTRIPAPHLILRMHQQAHEALSGISGRKSIPGTENRRIILQNTALGLVPIC
jgi:hypothetical protein